MARRARAAPLHVTHRRTTVASDRQRDIHDWSRPMIKGSCLCGGIRFEIDKVRVLTHCHCSNCRKLTGAAFGSYVHVDADKFRLLSGEELMQQFESAPGSFRF